MFTGIVTDVGKVVSAEQRGDLRLRVQSGYDMGTVDLGASIACSGVCLTVVDKGEDWFAVDVSGETVSRTAGDMWKEGARLNLERSLRLGDELGGHIVAGHADGLATVVAREDLTDMARFSFYAPAELARFIAPKGSVALDGVSLTVNEVADDTFSVLIIPHTLKVTTLGALAAGDHVNLEVDLMARYAARLMARR